MADLSFARKYRPSKLSEYIGNEKLKNTALASLRRDKRPQVILLAGDSGCGKTTFARLLAKEYLCEDRDPLTGACNQCISCQELDDYILTGDSSILANVREVDIADQSGKRDIDTVLEEMEIPAFGDQWKIFIFDEVHMATKQAQNRMLKIVEEPPENVLIIFCTTDPDMLLETLRNRCQLTLRVKKPSVLELSGLLKRVCDAEGADSDAKGLNFVANRAGLTIRKALSSLEQVINEKGDCTYDSAVDVFEEISDTLIIDYFRKMIGTPVIDDNGEVLTDEDGQVVYKRDIIGCVYLLHKIKESSGLASFVNELVEFTKRGIYVINQIQLDGVADGELKVYRELFGSFTIEQVATLVEKLLELSSRGGDIETKLLSLSYTGIQASSGVSKAHKEEGSGLQSLNNEISQENKNSNKVVVAQAKAQEENGIIEASKLNKPAELSDIESMFGNIQVSLP